MTSPDHLEAMARALEESGQYRVLRKLEPRQRVPGPIVGARIGLFVDVETTGLDPTRDEIIELAMVPFRYGPDGRVWDVGEAFSQLRQPTVTISAEITSLTGITDDMVRGYAIDENAVAAFASQASVVMAHNAGFDRRFLERAFPVFRTMPWACSMTQVAWKEEGFEGVMLSYLAAQSGFFYERHRAVHDCLAAIELLARPLPRSGVLAMGRLLERARDVSWRIWAENSPYHLKDTLKARGYRWNGEANSLPRAWFVDVAESAREAEISYLQREIYRSPLVPLMRRIDAYDRFSERC